MKLIKENVPFTMVANEVLKNPKLSFKAKGLYAYLFSKPDTWDFSSSRMVLETKDSREAIMGMLRELESAGYLMRKRLSTGRVEYTLIFSNQSLSREIPLGVEKPKSEIAYVANSLRGENIPISNIYQTNNTKKESNKETPDWLDKEIWNNWLEYRKERRLTMTPKTISLQLKELEKDKSNHKEIIEQSIRNGWAGIFPLKKVVGKKTSLLEVNTKYDKYENNK